MSSQHADELATVLPLECLLVGNSDVDLHPTTKRRDWMDATEHAFAYRCLPLRMANTQGWAIRCGSSFDAQWNGGDRPDDVRISATNLDDEPLNVSGHFGHGILTLSHEVIFRTPPGFNLWVTGPVNRFKDAIQPLSAVVEADWMPFTFTMNWRFTRPHARVHFEKGEPYCQTFPIQRGLVEVMDPETDRLDNHPELRQQYEVAKRRRGFRRVVEQIRPGYAAPDNLRFQGWYTRGVLPDESEAAAEHDGGQRAKPFRRNTPAK